MKKKYSIKQLQQLEKDMSTPSLWQQSDHTVSYKGPTSIRFNPQLLQKLHALAKAKNKTISKLVNDYVKAFAEGEYELLSGR